MTTSIDLVLGIVNRQIIDTERRGQNFVMIGPNTLKTLIGEIYRLRARLAPADEIGEDELPVHFPIAVTEGGQGPADDTEWFMTVCWCADPQCTKFYPRDNLVGK